MCLKKNFKQRMAREVGNIHDEGHDVLYDEGSDWMTEVWETLVKSFKCENCYSRLRWLISDPPPHPAKRSQLPWLPPTM